MTPEANAAHHQDIMADVVASIAAAEHKAADERIANLKEQIIEAERASKDAEAKAESDYARQLQTILLAILRCMRSSPNVTCGEMIAKLRESDLLEVRSELAASRLNWFIKQLVEKAS